MLWIILFLILLIVFFLSPWSGKRPKKPGCFSVSAAIFFAVLLLVVLAVTYGPGAPLLPRP